MKKLLSILMVIVTMTILSTSCTQNSRAKNFGGKAELELPAGQKLIEVTWKEEPKEDKKLEEMFKSWNWNLNPAEVATEIKDCEFEPRVVLSAMESFGFSKNDIGAVEDVLEVIR